MVVGRKPDLTSARTEASHTGNAPPSPQDAQGTIVELSPPDDMSGPGLQAWDVIVPPLLAAKILRPEDVPLVVEACESWALVWYFRKALWAEIQASTPDSQEIKRLRSGWNDSLRQARLLLSDLGVGPVSRIRTGLMARSEGGITMPSLGELGVEQDDDDGSGSPGAGDRAGAIAAAAAAPGNQVP